jgi:hypothetical protein
MPFGGFSTTVAEVAARQRWRTYDAIRDAGPFAATPARTLLGICLSMSWSPAEAPALALQFVTCALPKGPLVQLHGLYDHAKLGCHPRPVVPADGFLLELVAW